MTCSRSSAMAPRRASTARSCFTRSLPILSGETGRSTLSSSCSSAIRTALPRSTTDASARRSSGPMARSRPARRPRPARPVPARAPPPGAARREQAPPRITSSRPSGSWPESCRRSSRKPRARSSPAARRSSPAAEHWSSRSAKPPPRPTDARPSLPGCARCRSIRCCGRSPMPRSSRASTANAMPGSISIRRCSSCAWCWPASGNGPFHT